MEITLVLTGPQPDNNELRGARAIYESLTADTHHVRWDDLPAHRKWRYVHAAQAALEETSAREVKANVIAMKGGGTLG